MNPYKIAAGLLLAVSACLAQAAPVDSTAQGYAGANVTVKLNDPSTLNLIGFTAAFTYDPTFLTYVSGALGSIQPQASLVLDLLDVDSNSGVGVASMAYPSPVADASNGSLLELVFLINANAQPGETTEVDFVCVPFTDQNNVTSCEYDFDVTATVTVLQRTGTPIPLPGTLPLLSLGVAALWWARRRMV